MINCYAFGAVPPFAQGLVRDLRVRWALEEAGLPYRVTLVGDRPGATSRSDYRAVQPFGQIPAIEDGDLTLFESGAIVLYVAERSGDAAAGRCRRTGPSVHPVDVRRAQHDRGPDPATGRDRPLLRRRALGQGAPSGGGRVRADSASRQLASCLDGREYLVGSFSAADILMTSVLRILRHTELLRGATRAGRLQAALRGATGVREGARRPDGGLRDRCLIPQAEASRLRYCSKAVSRSSTSR